MAGTPTFRPLDEKFRFRPKGQFLIRPKGSNILHKAGDYDEFKFSYELEEDDTYSNEYPIRTKVDSEVTQADITISFTSRMLPGILREIAYMSSTGLSISQAAAVAEAGSTADIAAGQVIRLPHRKITDIDVTGNAGGVQYVVGQHYKIDAEGGFLEVFDHPVGATVGADGTATIDYVYDADAIAAQRAYGILSNTDRRFELIFVQNMRKGPQIEAGFHEIQLRAEGDVMLGADGEENGTMGFTGKAFPDPTKPAGFELGQIVDRVTRGA